MSIRISRIDSFSRFNMGHILIPILVLLLSSCDCFIKNQGTVIDKQTRKPVEGVNVYMIIRKATLRNLAYQLDSLTFKQRDSLNDLNPEQKKKWKKEKWHYPVTDIIKRYVKNVPCITDSSGNYDLYFFGPYCPKFSIRFVKEGYKDLLISRDSLWSIQEHQEKRLTFELIRQ